MPGSLTSKSKALLGGISLGFHTMPRFSSSSSSVHCARELRERERERREESVRALQQDTAATREERKETTKEGMVCFLFAISGHDHFLQGMESQRRESVQRPSSSY